MKVVTAVACVLILASVGIQAQIPAQPGSNGQPQPQSAPETKTPSGQTEIDPAKAADIGRLLEVTGAEQLGMQMMTEMEKSIKPLMTNALPPGEYRDKLVDLFFVKFRSKADPHFIRKLAIPVYDKYFSDQEIRDLIEFYSTPLGKKTLSVLPKAVAEMQEGGRKWGEELGRKSMVEVLSEHPDLASALETAKKAEQTRSQ